MNIYGINYLSNIIKYKFPEIAQEYLGLNNEGNKAIVTAFEDIALEQLSKTIAQVGIKEFKDNRIDEIKEKISNAYKKAIKIVNTPDALYFVSKKDKDTLSGIIKTLEVLEFYYKDLVGEEARHYYHNYFVIYARTDIAAALQKFDSFPEIIKNNEDMKFLYANFSLVANINVESVIKFLTTIPQDEKVIEILARCYFGQENYKGVVELLNDCDASQFDKYGFLASALILSKDRIKKYKIGDLLKYKVQAFRDMPLYYLTTAQIIQKENRKDKKVLERFKKAIKLTNSEDVPVIVALCDACVSMGMQNEMIKYLISIELNSYLKLRLVELLCNKRKLSDNEITKLEELKDELNDDLINIKFIDALILELKGKFLESIKKYEESFNETSNVNSAYKYIELSINNFSNIDDNLLKKLSLDKDINSTSIVANAYYHKLDYQNAIPAAYNALYLMGNKENKTVISQYWTIIMMSGSTLYREVKTVGKNVGIKLQETDSKKAKKIIIDDSPYYEENMRIMDFEIIKSNSDFGMELTGKKINDAIKIEDKDYVIKEIKDKYTIIAHECYPALEKIKGFKAIKTEGNDIEELKKTIIEITKQDNENRENQLDIYINSKNVPLSVFFSKEKSVSDYAKIINHLLFSSNRQLLTGEPIDVDISNGFVIDLSSIIVIALLNKLAIFNDELIKKIFITKSLKNKLDYHYNSLLLKQGKKEISIGSIKAEDCKDNFFFNEIMVDDQIEFWKQVYKIINKINVIEFEAEFDEILKIERLWDKVQFDLIKLAVDKDIPYICDDLVIRKIASMYKARHSNSISIFDYVYFNDVDSYTEVVEKLIDNGYIYAVYYGKTFGNILKYVYDNYNDDSIIKLENIINKMLNNKTNFDYYINILLGNINNLTNLVYTKILDNIYENIRVKSIIEIIIKGIKDACSDLELDFHNYEKKLNKNIIGTELTFDIKVV